MFLSSIKNYLSKKKTATCSPRLIKFFFIDFKTTNKINNILSIKTYKILMDILVVFSVLFK